MSKRNHLRSTGIVAAVSLVSLSLYGGFAYGETEAVGEQDLLVNYTFDSNSFADSQNGSRIRFLGGGS